MGKVVKSVASIALTIVAAYYLPPLAAFVVVTAVNSALNRASVKKPKPPSFTEEARGRTENYEGVVEPQRMIYGQVRTGGMFYPISTANSGTVSTGGTSTGENLFLHFLIVLAAHEVEEIGDIYLNDKLVTLDGNGYVQEAPYFRHGRSYARITKYLGTDDQTADANLVAECPSVWTTAHHGKGIAYLYCRFEYGPDVFPLGRPKVTAVIKGKKVYDPREVGHDPDDSTTWEWSDNTALCIRDYLTSRDTGGYPYGFGVSSDEINDTYTEAAANICDESVTLADGSTQARYTCNGILDTGVAPLENLQQMISAMAGAVTCPKGAFRIHAGAYDTPETTVIDEEMLAGDIKIWMRIPRNELFNAVRGTFVDPGKEWQLTEFPALTSTVFEAQDGGERIYTDIQLPFTTNVEAAQRIAKLIRNKAREQISVEMPLNYRALEFAVWDTVKATNAGFGWTEKVFRIEKLTFDLIGGVTLKLKEENSASYDWSATDAELVDAAPDTNLPDPFTVIAPGALTITEGTYVTRDGAGVKAYATMTWLPSTDAFLDDYQPEYKLAADSDYTKLPRTRATSVDIFDIEPGTYDFRVSAYNRIGVSSAADDEYTEASKQISGLLAPPTEPQNLTISSIGGLVILRWDQSPDVDVKIGGKYVFRHSPDTSSTWTESTSIGNAVPGVHTIATLPQKPGIYFAKAVDSSGVESTAAASVTTEQATALTFANVDSITEHPGFAGVKSGCHVDDLGFLTISGAGMFDDIADLDAVTDLDAYGGIAASGTYTFSAGIDLGSVMPVRLTSHVLASIVNTLDMIDDRTDDIDDWVSFDGTAAAVSDAIAYARTTNDDPAGAPAWGAWHRLDSAEFNNRAFQFKLEMTTADPAYNVLVEELSVTADEVV